MFFKSNSQKPGLTGVDKVDLSRRSTLGGEAESPCTLSAAVAKSLDLVQARRAQVVARRPGASA